MDLEILPSILDDAQRSHVNVAGENNGPAAVLAGVIHEIPNQLHPLPLVVAGGPVIQDVGLQLHLPGRCSKKRFYPRVRTIDNRNG